MAYAIESEIEGCQLPVFIDGEFSQPRSSTLIDSIDPSYGTPWYQLYDCNDADIDDAVRAANTAFNKSEWRNLTPTDRGDLIYRLADLIEQQADNLAEIETRDNGKLIKETGAQIRYLKRYYRYYAGIADKLQGDVLPINREGMLNYTMREPLGVVGLIVPWNSPLNTLSVTTAACLAAGNTLVVKPSEHTSASAIAFANLIKQAGFPDGVFNVVSGYGATAGDALTRHPGIAKIAFTGGTDTGIKVATNAAAHIAPCVMELGGKSPHVIFADADINRAINGVVAGVFAAAGQTCIAGSRCFVEQTVYDAVVEQLGVRTRQVKIGHPKTAETHLGPVATAEQYEKVSAYIQYGLDDGARLIAGGKTVTPQGLEGGYYIEPTLFAEADSSMRLFQDEIFGPVVGVQAFSDEADLIEKANDTRYGLASGIWTSDIDKAMRFARDVDAGTVWVNTYRTAAFMTPMGGFKDSGYGKHNGFDGLREWTRSKNVMIDYSGSTQDPFVMQIK
ncbi:MAG: acyl-CoA reductase-like NAD-dependent aldehyde dehydrogenase [Planctomycetota bacterium]|jgi:acyl-CoA reductase-like NAD-dependent aldehyde dehydrogenase